MSNNRERIKKCLELAEKGAFHKDNIKQLIKEDFYNMNNGIDSILSIYDKLGRKYGYSSRHIRTICTN